MTNTPVNRSAPTFIPERLRKEWAVGLLVFALSALYLWPFRAVTDLFQDEGIVLQGAQRILEGQVLYRDFFSFYTPGSFYWMALLFKVFGSSYLVARTLLPIYGAVFSLLTYLLARRVCSRWSAVLGAYLFLVIALPYRFLHLHNWDSLVLAYVAIYCAVRFVESPGKGWAFATGTFVSLTTLFEHSKGVGLAIGLVLGLAVVLFAGRGKELVSRSRVAALIAGFAWPFVPVFVYFTSQHALAPMIADWLWPLTHYSGSNRLPYGWINLSTQGWEALYGSGSLAHRVVSVLFTSPCFIWPVIPFLAVGFMVFHAVLLRRGTDSAAASKYFVMVSAGCVGLTISAILTSRPDIQHLLFAGAPLSVVLAWILGGVGVNSSLLAKVRPILVVYFLVFFTAFGVSFMVTGPMDAPYRVETRRGTVKLSKPDEVIPYLMRHVARGGKIFIYPQQPLYYYLTGTSNPTQHDYFQLGMHSQKQFERAITELEAARPRTVVWDFSFNTETILQGWPSTRLEELEKDPVREFILANYRPCTALRSVDFRYVVMVREDLGCTP